MYRFLIITSLIIGVTSANGQNREIVNQSSVWVNSLTNFKVNRHFGFLVEPQIRRADWGTNWQQAILSVGIHKYIGTSLVTLGFSQVATWPYGALPAKSRFPESRPWVQLFHRSQIGRVELITRLRQEFRLIKVPVLSGGGSWSPGQAKFNHRSRMLHRFSVPLNQSTMRPGTYYISGFDEVLISWGKNVKFNLFDQNRAFLGIGRMFAPNHRLEIGYLNQAILKSDGVKMESNHTIFTNLLLNINLEKKKE